jgi:hypothetical protein
MKFPHLYRVIADDNLREAMTVAYVTKTKTYATNAHVMAIHQTEKIFDQAFVESLPKEGLALPVNILKAICLRSVSSVTLSENKKVIILHGNNWTDPTLHFNLTDASVYKFPEYEKVMFTEKDAQELKDICVSTKLLGDLMKALDPYGPQFLKMFFSTSDKAILCKLKIDSDFYGAEGVIMPAMY